MQTSTQISRIANHLAGGNTITPAEAVVVFGCFRLASVIEDLRKRGWEIDTVMKKDAAGKSYASYRLTKQITTNGTVQVRQGYGYGLPRTIRKSRGGVVKVIHQDVAYVEFQQGRGKATYSLNLKELVAA